MDFLIVAGIVSLLALLLSVICKMYVKLTTGWCKSERDMSGKTAIITGANSGIGRETARDLAKRRAKVILACRSIERGKEAAAEIIASTGNPEVHVKECDLSSLRSVRSFCKQILNSEDRLDILICNAGMVPPPGRYLTEDFLEVQFATNHLGHFLLTNLLLDLLKRSKPARIVVVSSLLHHLGAIDFENLNFEKYTPDPFFTYCKTKLANVLFVKELSRRLASTGVIVNALHPGLVKTEINRRTPWYVKNLFQPVLYMWAKNLEEGSQTTIYLSVSEEVEGVTGKYFSDCRQVWSSRKGDDLNLASRLWEISETLTGLKTSV